VAIFLNSKIRLQTIYVPIFFYYFNGSKLGVSIMCLEEQTLLANVCIYSMYLISYVINYFHLQNKVLLKNMRIVVRLV
jgi:hypothetical protein